MIPVLIQTQSWLIQPKVWRFVGFGSSLVGLFCYAFSSSFNHLFGQWTFLKIFLYSIFSLIISFTILFANIWQHSRSHRFKAHSAFFVLTITTVYSFFSDKVVNNGKPDAYSLISCAAFSIMSLSLSRQIQCGFEVDLLYFFLGCLMMQLMKIKLQLVIVGAGFSYSLIILRSSLSSMDEKSENEYPELQDQHVVIQVDSSQQLVSINNFSVTQRLLTCMNELQQNNSNLTRMLLDRVKDNSGLAVTDPNFIIDALPLETMKNLQETAKLMVDAGFEKEFSEAVISWWMKFLEECLINKVLGLRKIGFQDYMIGRWIKASKVALRVLFPGWRQLCDKVFSGFSSSSASDFCFSEACRGATIQLLNFADAFTRRSSSAWRLFRILDMFQTMQGLIPEFQSLFPDSLVNEAMIRTQKRLGEASRDIFMELGNLIFDIPDAGLDAWADGRVHPMTTGVMGYFIPAFWSRQIIEQILQDFPKVADGAEISSFSTQMERITEQFEKKLEDKSKIYKDPALCCFFMMNNMRHIDSLLGTLVDDRFQRKTKQNFELYCRNSWSKVLDFLKLDINESREPNVVAESMKEQLNLFNLHFREICGVQSTWRVCDKQLRKQVIESVENILLPAYGNFIVRFKDILGKQCDEYVEYGMSDIKDKLNSTICLMEAC